MPFKKNIIMFFSLPKKFNAKYFFLVAIFLLLADVPCKLVAKEEPTAPLTFEQYPLIQPPNGFALMPSYPPINISSQKKWQVSGLKSALFQPDISVRDLLLSSCPPDIFLKLDEKERFQATQILDKLLTRPASSHIPKLGVFYVTIKLSTKEDSLPVLIELLKNDNLEVRQTAYNEFVKKASKYQVSTLIALLSDPDEYIRMAAARALGEIGSAAKESVPELRNLLNDPAANLRSSAAAALGEIGSAAKESVPELRKLLNDPVAKCRSSAAAALGEIGSAAKESVPELVTLLGDESSYFVPVDSGNYVKHHVRGAAALALGEFGDAAEESVPELIALLDENTIGSVRRDAITALGKLGHCAKKSIPVLTAMINDDSVYNVRDNFGKNILDSFRNDVLIAIGKIGTSSNKSINVLITLINHNIYAIRKAAIDAIGEIGFSGSYTSEIIALLNDNDVNTRIAAVLSLSKLRNSEKESIQVMISMLGDTNFLIRRAAVLAIMETGAAAKSAVPSLIDRLKDPDYLVRTYATEAIGKIGETSNDPVPILINLLKDPAPPVRIAAAQTLGSYGVAAKESVPALVRLLNGPDNDPVRETAARALGLIGVAESEAIPILIELLKYPNLDLRGAAINTLIKLGPISFPETLTILEQSYGYADLKARKKFLATYLSGGAENKHSQDIHIALEWLGDQTEAPIAKVKQNRNECLITLKAFLSIWNASTGLTNIQEDLANKIGKVAKSTRWRVQDIPLLLHHIRNLEAYGFNEAATLREVIPFAPATWLKKSSPLVKWLVFITVGYLALFFIGILLLCCSPKTLLIGLRLPWDKLAQVKPWLQFPISIFLTGSLLPFFAKRAEVREAWAKGYEKGYFTFADIPEQFVRFYIADQYVRNIWKTQYITNKSSFKDINPYVRKLLICYPETLDAWVEKRVSQVDRLFESDFFSRHQIYVPISIWIGGRENGRIFSDKPKPQDFNPLFASEQLILSIEGDGGTGKSMLACQLSRWAFRLENDLAPYRILPVIIDEEIIDPADIEDVITQRLRQMLGHEDVEKDIIWELLKGKRLMVIADALSERLPCTQKAIDNIHKYVPANLLVVTMRRKKYSFGNQPVTRLRPEKLNDVNQLVFFVTEYIKRAGYDQYLPRVDHFELVKTLLELAIKLIISNHYDKSETRATPLLIKIFVENAVSVIKRGESLDNMPMSIPETIFNYLRDVNPQDNNLTDYVPNGHMLSIAKAVAWLILEGDFTPRRIQRNQLEGKLISLLEKNENYSIVIDRLCKNGVLIQTEVAGELFINFNLDPLAEFLAATYQISYLANNEKKWREWLSKLRSSANYPEEMSGFLYSLQLCINSYQEHFDIPDIEKYRKIEK